MKKITILLADDHPVVRQGLRYLLTSEPDLEVLGEAETGRQAMEMVCTLHPDVVVMDISMPLLNGFEATQQILRHHPATRVLILSCHSSDDYVQHLISVGASGYVSKETAGTHLVKAVRQVHAGNAYYSALISRRMLQHQRMADRQSSRGPAEWRGTAGRLSPREREVLQLIAEGLCNKEIAAELFICIKTVEKHRQNAMDKLNIHNIAGLTRYAIGQGIVEATPKLA